MVWRIKNPSSEENNYSKKCFLPRHFVFLTSILRIEDWILQLDHQVIQRICDLKQDTEVSDMLMYSLAVTI